MHLCCIKIIKFLHGITTDDDDDDHGDGDESESSTVGMATAGDGAGDRSKSSTVDKGNHIDNIIRLKQRYKGGTDWYTCSKPQLFILLCLSIFAAVTTLSAVSSDFNTSNDTKSDFVKDFYSPGDSRLLPVSAVLYSSVIVKVSGTAATNASIYLVESPAVLAKDNNTVSFKERGSIAFMTFYFWDFYLYPNSNVSVNVCRTSELQLEVFLIKGTENLLSWEETRAHDDRFTYAESHYQVVEECQNLRYTVHEEDKYYVAVFNHNEVSTHASFEIELNFERFQYSSDGLPASTPTCVALPYYEECILNVSFSFEDKYALIITSIPTEVIWNENVKIEVSYSYWKVTCTVIACVYMLIVISVHFARRFLFRVH